MPIEDFKDKSKLEETLTKKDSVWLRDIYNELKKAEKKETNISLEELNLLKSDISNEVVYIMEYGDGYLVEKWDTISHINAMLPKWYSIKITNPKKLLSDSSIRVTVRNNKLLINGKIEKKSSIRWGENEESKKNFDIFKYWKWAKECFMSYDQEKNIFVAENWELIINGNTIHNLQELKRKTEEYREKKADNKAKKIADEAGVVYNKEKNIFIAENWKIKIDRDQISNAYELKRKIIEYKEKKADDKAEEIADKSGITYDKEKNIFVAENWELIISRKDISNIEQLKKIIYEYREKKADDKAEQISISLKDQKIIYDKEKKLYIYNWWEFMCSRDFIKNANDLKRKITEYLIEKEKSMKKVEKQKPKYLEYKVKKWDFLWNIIKHQSHKLWLKHSKNKNIKDYYLKNKKDIISINKLRSDKKWNPIIKIWQVIKLPILKTKKISVNQNSQDTATNKKWINSTGTIIEDMLPKDIIPNIKTNQQNKSPVSSPQDKNSEHSVAKQQIKPEINLSKNIEKNDKVSKLKIDVKNYILQDGNISEDDILWIDIEDKDSSTKWEVNRKYSIQNIIVYMKLFWLTKRLFQTDIWEEETFHELINSEQNYHFRLFLKSTIEKNIKNVFIREKWFWKFVLHYSLDWFKWFFERNFITKKKNWNYIFEEISDEKEIKKIELYKKMSNFWLENISMYPISFVDEIVVDGYKTFLYRCEYTDPNNNKENEGYFYIDKNWKLKEFIKT